MCRLRRLFSYSSAELSRLRLSKYSTVSKYKLELFMPLYFNLTKYKEETQLLCNHTYLTAVVNNYFTN